MNAGAEISQAFVVCISAVFTQNILLTYFLGLCPFLGVSREVKTATGLGLAVVFVLTATCMLNWLVYHYCLLYTSPSPRDLSTSRMPSSA